VSLSATSTQSAIWNSTLVGRVSVRECLPAGKGNLQAGTSLSRSIPVVVTRRQGKVVAINEAKDQHGGQLAFDNGETLNYEGGSPVPTRLLSSFILLHLTPI